MTGASNKGTSTSPENHYSKTPRNHPCTTNDSTNKYQINNKLTNHNNNNNHNNNSDHNNHNNNKNNHTNESSTNYDRSKGIAKSSPVGNHEPGRVGVEETETKRLKE